MVCERLILNMGRLVVLFFLVVSVCGCAYMKEEKGLDLNYEVVGLSQRRVFKNKDLVSPYKVIDSEKLLLFGNEKRYKVQLSGMVSFDVVLKYMCDVLGRVYNVGLVDFVGKKIDIDIDAEMSKDEIMVMLKAYADGVGLSVYDDGLVISIVVGSSGVEGDLYSVYYGVRYLDNIMDSLSKTVRILKVGGGVVLVGKKLDVLSLIEIIKLVDRDVFSGLEIVVIPYGMLVCDKVKEILAGIGLVKVFFVALGVDSSVLIMRDVSYKSYILSLLDKVSNEMVGSFYVVPVNNVDINVVKGVIKDFFDNSDYVVTPNGLVFKDYMMYRKVVELLRKIDMVERQLFVRLYLLDVESSRELNISGDIDIDRGSFSLSSAVRDSVGLGMFTSYKNFGVFLNLLIQKYDGKVLQNPSMVVKNGSTSSINFGQRIPVLKSNTQIAAGPNINLVQDVEYINVGLGVDVKIDMVNDYVYSNVSIINSSVLSGVGVEGNPQFANDSVRLSLVMKKGTVAVIAGLKRSSLSKNRVFSLLPQSLFNKKDKRELLFCMSVDEVGIERDSTDLMNGLNKLLDN